MNTILYADDQILMATSEDDLQTMANLLKVRARKYKMTIISTKTKSIALWGNHRQRVKIVINDNIIEEVTVFKYLWYRIIIISNLSNDRSKASSKTIPPHSAI